MNLLSNILFVILLVLLRKFNGVWVFSLLEIVYKVYYKRPVLFFLFKHTFNEIGKAVGILSYWFGLFVDY